MGAAVAADAYFAVSGYAYIIAQTHPSGIEIVRAGGAQIAVLVNGTTGVIRALRTEEGYTFVGLAFLIADTRGVVRSFVDADAEDVAKLILRTVAATITVAAD